MTDSFDDDTRFWDEPEWTRTGPIERVRPRGRSGSFERTRSHRVVRHDDPPPTQAMTCEDFAPHDDDAWGGVDHWVEPLVEHRVPAFVGIDPKLVRTGGVVLIGVLMIPLAMALQDDAGADVRSSEALAGAGLAAIPEALADPATTVVTVPITAAATAPVTAATTPQTAATSNSVAAAQAFAVVEPECAGTYTVIANDFWNRFPKTSGASVQEWLIANNATADTPLYVGDELCIPPGAQAPAPPPTTQAPTTTAAPATIQAPATTQAPAPTQVPVTTRAPAATVATTPPATAAPPVATAASTPVDPATVEAIIREVWPDDLEERALTIADRESSLRPEVDNGSCCYGLFQIHFTANRTFLETLGITSSEQLRDARTNTTAAYAMYQRSGWSPWKTTDPG